MFFRKFLLLPIAILMATGCGDSSSSGVVQGQSVSSTPALNAKVVSEDGMPVPGVRWVLQARTTNSQFEGLTGADGDLTVEVPPDVYDIGLDLEGDSTKATCFYGPVIVTGTSKQEFTIMESAGHQPGEVFGRILLQPGSPASNRQLTLRPGYGRVGLENLPSAVTVTTSSNGEFTTVFDSGVEIGLDLEVYEPGGNLDEWVDIARRSKPCFVQIAVEQTGIENHYRCNESELDLTTTLSTTALVNFQTSFEKFIAKSFTGKLGVRLVDGLIPIGTTYKGSELIEKDEASNKSEVDIIRDTSFRLDTNGSWWYTYAMNLSTTSKADGTRFWFTDLTKDTYHIEIDASGNHKVSYNSDKPEIEEILMEEF